MSFSVSDIIDAIPISIVILSCFCFIYLISHKFITFLFIPFIQHYIFCHFLKLFYYLLLALLILQIHYLISHKFINSLFPYLFPSFNTTFFAIFEIIFLSSIFNTSPQRGYKALKGSRSQTEPVEK